MSGKATFSSQEGRVTPFLLAAVLGMSFPCGRSLSCCPDAAGRQQAKRRLIERRSRPKAARRYRGSEGPATEVYKSGGRRNRVRGKESSSICADFIPKATAQRKSFRSRRPTLLRETGRTVLLPRASEELNERIDLIAVRSAVCHRPGNHAAADIEPTIAQSRPRNSPRVERWLHFRKAGTGNHTATESKPHQEFSREPARS